MIHPTVALVGIWMKAAMKEAHINTSKIRPFNIPDLPPGTHAYDPKSNNLTGVLPKVPHQASTQSQSSRSTRTSKVTMMRFTLMAPRSTKRWVLLLLLSHASSRMDKLHTTCRRGSLMVVLQCWGHGYHLSSELLQCIASSTAWCGDILRFTVMSASSWGHWAPTCMPNNASSVETWVTRTSMWSSAGYPATVELGVMKQSTNLPKNH